MYSLPAVNVLMQKYTIIRWLWSIIYIYHLDLSSISIINIYHLYLSSISIIYIYHLYLSSLSIIYIYHLYLSSISIIYFNDNCLSSISIIYFNDNCLSSMSISHCEIIVYNHVYYSHHVFLCYVISDLPLHHSYVAYKESTNE